MPWRGTERGRTLRTLAIRGAWRVFVQHMETLERMKHPAEPLVAFPLCAPREFGRARNTSPHAQPALAAQRVQRLPGARLPRALAVVTVLAAAGVLAGCGALVRTPYERPAVQTPAQWQTAQPTDVAQPDATGPSGEPAQYTDNAEQEARSGPWWQHFHDATLTALIEQVLARNNDLAQAGLRLQRAQLQTWRARMDLYPSANLSGNASGSARQDFGSGASSHAQTYSATLNIGWEVDLWGRIEGLHDAAAWAAQASAEDLQATRLSLIGTTMQLYWQAALLNERIATAQHSRETTRRTLELIRGQYRAGAATGLDVVEAESSLASQDATLVNLTQQRAETLNALALLSDAPPSQDTSIPAQLPDAAPPDVPAGIPAELLARRPDLRAAEWRLRGALVNVDNARSSYYPRVSLTGALGAASSTLGELLKNPIGTLAASLMQPLLDWTQIRFNTESARLQYEEAVIGFRQQLYRAMADVNNALTARDALMRQGQALQAALDSARQAERMTEARYRTGSTSLRAWLDAQDRRRQAEVNVSQNRYNRYLNQVTLYQALGGDAVVL